MENFRNTDVNQFEFSKTGNEKTLMVYTFGWMFLALAISATLAIAFHFIPSLDAYLFNEVDGVRTSLSISAYIAIFAPLAISLVINFGFNRLSFQTLVILFMAYSAFIGISFSTLFYIYRLDSLITVFLASAGLFGTMALIGATTKTDLTKMGSFLMMALFGLVIAMLINFFTHSAMMDYVISFVGVIIFTGLAAYHTQSLKELSAQSDGSVAYKKLSIISALQLYVTFINLFLFLLRLFGRRN